ncbi:MAG: hypothetical protein GY870_05360 [archaeon]|nr:hypothetical protein [archaeon]
MTNIFEKFEKIKTIWKNSIKTIPYGELSKKTLFELVYHASNEVPFRCIHVVTKPGEAEAGNEAVIYSSLDKIFTSISGNKDSIELAMYAEEEAGLGRIDEIIDNLNKGIENFKGQTENVKEQIPLTILVERKIDEVVNLSMNKDLSRKVYFAIGEVRERGALIQLIMSAKGGDLVQLAVMKWMNIALNEPQDNPFPQEKVKGLVKNFLQIKKWIIDLINKSFTATEEELLPKGKGIDEE